MQSGITASPSLLSAFQTLLTTPTQRGLLASIEDESLVPVAQIPSTSSSFHDDLSNLKPYLKPNAALYILLRRDPSPNSTTTSNSSGSNTGSLVAITYVPDAAPVRQKMLFASTRLALIRELGSENFGETVFATTAEELSKEGWARHEAHVEGAKPLTEEERSLEGIKEAEARESGGMERRGAGYGKGGLAMGVGEGVREALGALGRGEEGGLVQLGIDVSTETITLVSVSDASPSDLSSAISSSEPRYSFYRYTYDGSSEPPIIFIYTCPSSSKIKERMVYASSRAFVVGFAETEGGLTVAKKLEATDPDEITAATIEEEFQPRQEAKSGFARPKRPGRR